MLSHYLRRLVMVLHLPGGAEQKFPPSPGDGEVVAPVVVPRLGFLSEGVAFYLVNQKRSHSIQAWYIYLHLVDLYGLNVGKLIYHTWIVWG